MIWNDSIAINSPQLKSLAGHIAAEIGSAGTDCHGEGVNERGELAGAVAEFALDHSNGVMIPSDYLLLLVCRALWAIGCEEEARAMLRTKGPELNIGETYADAVFAGEFARNLGLHSAFVRALRPSSPAWSLNGPCWILDLREVFSFPDSSLEIAVWRAMHGLVRQLAGLWDAASGKGTLGLRHSHFIVADLLSLPRKSRRGKRITSELVNYCKEVLESAAVERKWRFVPAAVDMG